MNTSDKITDKEKKEFEYALYNAICKCGHPRKEHNKFIDCLFIGCMHTNCNCKKFELKEGA